MVLLVVDTQKLITNLDLYNFIAFENAVKTIIETGRESSCINLNDIVAWTCRFQSSGRIKNESRKSLGYNLCIQDSGRRLLLRQFFFLQFWVYIADEVRKYSFLIRRE